MQVPTGSGDHSFSKFLIYIYILVLFPLLISAFVHLQLFQDGSSYLFELLATHSAVRHHRVTVLLIQIPSIALDRLLSMSGVDATSRLQAVRLAFPLSYSLVPFIALLLSWYVIRRKNVALFVWVGLIILFINLVNFSWYLNY